jgi:HK97 family phage major capsid protein
MTQKVENMEQFMGVLKDAVPELLRSHPQIFIDAMANSRDAMVTSLRAAGFVVADGAADPALVRAARHEAIEEGLVLGGFGTRTRSNEGLRLKSVHVAGRGLRRSYIGDLETEKMCNAWLRAFMAKDGVDHISKENVFQLHEKLERGMRAPAAALTNEVGTAGGYMIPTIIAAEIYMEMTERFVLQGMVQVYVSDQSLQIDRRTALVAVSRGQVATNIGEVDFRNTIGMVKLDPQRVGALTYVSPRLANASAMGPVRYVISQLAEALARDAQRCIVGGVKANLEPIGIDSLPTADPQAFNNVKTQAWTNTDLASQRQSIRKAYYKISQPHRETANFIWVTNSDGFSTLSALNDMNQPNFFRDPQADGSQPTMLGKRIIESSAIVTDATPNPDTTKLLGGDMGQYAWQETTGGLRIDQTAVGGEAWVSDTIGIKAVQEYDGAPVIPPAFVKISDMAVN